MSEPTIICPKCKSEIKLTESLAAPLIESIKADYETQLTDKDADIAKREEAVRAEVKALKEAKASIDEEVIKRLQEERGAIAAAEAKKARLHMGAELEQKGKELEDLQSVLAARDKKLADAQKAQVELIKKQRELDDAKREMDLTIETRVQEGLATTRDKVRKEVEGELKLKVAEKEQTITSMQKQIEDLKRRAEQGSQQLQGEVQELELEKLLGTQFPFAELVNESETFVLIF